MVLSSISEIPELVNDKVLIRDEEQVLQIINKMILDGHKKFRIVTDFDYTLTKHVKENGEKADTSFDIFKKCPSVPAAFVKKYDELANKYRPKETDPSLSEEDKKQAMAEWFQKFFDALQEHVKHFPLSQISKQAHESLFRDGVNELVNWCEERQVPILVFSAGTGEVVDILMKETNLKRSNVNIVANFCKLDNDGKVHGLINDFIIHTHNKLEAIANFNELFEHNESVRDRRNVLVMGDNVKDARMVEDTDDKNVIRIGFLNRNIDENKEQFKETFDIVLISDLTMNVPNALLRLL